MFRELNASLHFYSLKENLYEYEKEQRMCSGLSGLRCKGSFCPPEGGTMDIVVEKKDMSLED